MGRYVQNRLISATYKSQLRTRNGQEVNSYSVFRTLSDCTKRQILHILAVHSLAPVYTYFYVHRVAKHKHKLVLRNCSSVVLAE